MDAGLGRVDPWPSSDGRDGRGNNMAIGSNGWGRVRVSSEEWGRLEEIRRK